MKYKINAPNGTITIGLGYGNLTFTHGEVVENLAEAQFFPNIFVPIPEPEQNLVEKLKDVIESSPIVELLEPQETPLDIKVELPKVTKPKVTKPKGRPKKIPFSTKG